MAHGEKLLFFFFFFSFSFSSARVLRRAALSIVGCCNVVQHYQCQGQLYIAAGVPVPIGNWVGCLTGSRDKRSEPSPNDSDSIVPLSRMKTDSHENMIRELILQRAKFFLNLGILN